MLTDTVIVEQPATSLLGLSQRASGRRLTAAAKVSPTHSPRRKSLSGRAMLHHKVTMLIVEKKYKLAARYRLFRSTISITVISEPL